MPKNPWELKPAEKTPSPESLREFQRELIATVAEFDSVQAELLAFKKSRTELAMTKASKWMKLHRRHVEATEAIKKIFKKYKINSIEFPYGFQLSGEAIDLDKIGIRVVSPDMRVRSFAQTDQPNHYLYDGVLRNVPTSAKELPQRVLPLTDIDHEIVLASEPMDVEGINHNGLVGVARVLSKHPKWGTAFLKKA